MVELYLDIRWFDAIINGSKLIEGRKLSTILRIFNIDNIRDVTFLYRGPNRVNP